MAEPNETRRKISNVAPEEIPPLLARERQRDNLFNVRYTGGGLPIPRATGS